MLKEKCESVKKFVNDHKVELALGGLAAALGATVLYQHKINVSMLKLHEAENEINEKEIEVVGKLIESVKTLGKGVEIIGRGTVMANNDIESLAKHNGLTMEDVWKIGLEAKEALTETIKDFE